MIKNIGKFKAYVPDREPYDVVLNIFSYMNKDEQFSFNPREVQQFFKELKHNNPTIFCDIYFNDDDDFPYSEEIDKALTRLQDVGFVTRPNPTFYRYKLDANLEKFKEAIPDSERDIYAQLAYDFKSRFYISN